MLNRKLLTGMVLSLLFSGAVAAHEHDEGMALYSAEHGMHQMREHGPRAMERTFAKLDLSSEQQAQIKALHEADRENSKATHEQMKPLHEALHDLMEADDINESAIKSAVAQIAEMRAQLMIQHAKTHQKVVALLNDEQRAKLNEMQTKHKERMQRRQEERADEE